MKRKEWAILVLLMVGVAALEVFGTDDGSPQPPRSADSVPKAPRSTEPDAPSERTADPMEAYRTGRLHVTGMT